MSNTLLILYHPLSKPFLKPETFKNVKTFAAAWKIIFKRNRASIKKAVYSDQIIIGK